MTRCTICECEAVLHRAADFYRNPNLKGVLWQCAPCDATVSCHPGTNAPMGNFADRRTRRLRMAAHEAFDPIWQEECRRSVAKYKRKHLPGMKVFVRNGAYKSLADALGIDFDDCHIALLTDDQLQRVVEVCAAGMVKAPRWKPRHKKKPSNPRY